MMKICIVFAVAVGTVQSQTCDEGSACSVKKNGVIANSFAQKKFSVLGRILINDGNPAAYSLGETPQAYFKITSGSCDDQGGMAIRDMTECESAARAVGFDFGYTNTYTCSEHPGVCNNRRPQGCFKEANQLALFPDSTGGCSYWGPSYVSTACFCKRAPPAYFKITHGSCGEQGGVAIRDMTECENAARAVGFDFGPKNTYTCSEHSGVCNNRRPQGCFKEANRLALFPDSTGDCSYWGPSYVSTACFCKREPPAYFKITRGSCDDQGGTAIRDMADCENAARAVGFDFGYKNTYTCSEHPGVCNNRRPQGCFKEANQLALFPDSTGECAYWGPSYVSTACFCKRAPPAYFKITRGSCGEQGGTAIRDMTDCENAARAVGFDFGHKNTYTCSEHPGVCNNRRPQGCFKEANQLALFPDSTGDCSYWGPSYVSTACFCKRDSTTSTTTTPSTTTSTSTTTACQIGEDNDSFRDQMGLSCNDWPNGHCIWAGQWGYSASGQRALVSNCGTTCGMCELPKYMKEIRGINYCSGAYTKITSSAECKTGSQALGHHFSRYDFNSIRAPTGCFNTKSGGTAYYNRKPNGRADSFYSPICVRKPETANEPTPHGYVLVKIRHECKASQKWVSCTKKTVKDCADHVREAGGQFFQFGINKQHGQCFMKKTQSEDCPEGFKGSPFYNFYRLDEPPTTAAPTTVAPTTTSKTLAPEWRDVLLNKHNYFRAQEGSSSMPKLIWDTALEESSQRWVDKCTFGHSFADDAGMYNDCANNACGQQNGENLWMGSALPELETAVEKWYIEKLDYNYGDGIFRSDNCATGKMCGHYTQVVSAATLKLGCAVKSDCNGEWKSYIVCQYSPAGNVEGHTLFKKNGAACSECPIAYNCCDEGLCVGTPPVPLTGAFSWDMMCDGGSQQYMLNMCEATPLTSTGKSHQVVTLTAQERMWAVKITLYNDSSCSSDSMAMDAQEAGICDSQIGFNNKFTYDGPDSMPIAPKALTNGECSN